MAHPVALSPAPQELTWGDEMVKTPKTLVLVGAEEADVDAVALLRNTFSEGQKGVQVVIGERGDKAVADYTELIPTKVEG